MYSSITQQSIVQEDGLKPVIVWTIAGSDSGGGAGIQADLRAFQAFGVYGCSAIAALTAQNSVAVESILPVSSHFLDAQLSALASDMPPAAIKTGMLGSVENIRVVTRWVDILREKYPEKNIVLVVDPIYRSSTGTLFSSETLRQEILSELLPRATLLKPNAQEAHWLLTGEVLANAHIKHDLFPEWALQLKRLGAQNIVITGGDMQYGEGDGAWTDDWLESTEATGWLGLPTVNSTTTHGTGCTFTASAAAAMALGFCAADAVILAKMATTQGIKYGCKPGEGVGSVNLQAGFALAKEGIPFLRVERKKRCPIFLPCTENDLGLYPIVNSSEQVKKVIDAGAKTIQLRMKLDELNLPEAMTVQSYLADEVKKSVQYAKEANIHFYVNDHWKLALEHGAYGVHLGQEDLLTADLDALRAAGMRLGVSIYSLWEVCIAQWVNPSYYGCGPIFATSSKEVPWKTQGVHNLAYYTFALDKPIVAIGGIQQDNLMAVMQGGAQGFAMIRAINEASNLKVAIEELNHEIERGRALPTLTPPLLPRSVL